MRKEGFVLLFSISEKQNSQNEVNRFRYFESSGRRNKTLQCTDSINELQMHKYSLFTKSRGV
jgi:hypothetical protein